MVEAGQKRLIELQQPDGGWAWQGNGQTHEMMTPYALFGLIAAEEAGYPCPNPNTIPHGYGAAEAVPRIRWAASGTAVGTTRTEKASHPVVNDALFCLWVVRMTDKPDDRTGLVRPSGGHGSRRRSGRAAMSDYGHAFALELAVKHKKKELADKLAAELRKRAKKSGDHVYWTTAGFSRWGDNTIEVTATVMKALVAHDADDPLIPGVLAFFHGTKRGDRWDSTKDTACVLYALCDYLAAVKAGPAGRGAGEGQRQRRRRAEREARLAGVEGGEVRRQDLKPGENIVHDHRGARRPAGRWPGSVVSFTRGRGADIPARDHGVKVERTVSVRGADGVWTELKSGRDRAAGELRQGSRDGHARGRGPDQLHAARKPEAGAAARRCRPTTRASARAADATGHVLREDREAMYRLPLRARPGGLRGRVRGAGGVRRRVPLAPARVELMYKPTVGGHSDSFVLKVAEKK